MKIKAIVIGILLCAPFAVNWAAAQSPSGTPAPGSIEAALAVEDPAERIAALRKFLKNNIIPEQTQTAQEAIVASWAQIADSHLNNNDIEKAVTAFRDSIGSLPENITDTFFNDTVIRIPLAVSVRGYRNEAILLARRLEARFPQEGKRLAAIGEFYMTIEAPADAIRALENAGKAGENTAMLHRALGAAYRIGLRLDDAIAEYQQAIQIDPLEKRAYYELGNLYRAYGAYDDALKLYRKQLEIEPKHTSSYKGIALAHLAMGDEEKATAALNQARDIRGASEELTQDLYLQTQLAFLYLQRNNLLQARKAAEAALLIEPRYAWARIATAEVDLAEGKFFDAERNLLAARPYASFPSLNFTFGKLYLAVEDFNGAIEQFATAFQFSPTMGFTTRLGGSMDVEAGNLADLLAREHRAAIYLAESPTKAESFRIAESLVRFDVRLRLLREQIFTAQRPATRQQLEELDKEAMDFIEIENLRRSFRSLYIAQRLALAGVSTGTATELADIALGLADIAVGPEGSIRDYPNYDFQGRLNIFRGRALDAKGWALFKSGRNEEAVDVLSQAVAAYGSHVEGKKALWHLATARETLGATSEALNLYIAGYEPPSEKSSSDIGRAVIEVLYRKVNGSLDGLEQRLSMREATSNEVISTLSQKYGVQNAAGTRSQSVSQQTNSAPESDKTSALKLDLSSSAPPTDRSRQLRDLSSIIASEKTSRATVSPTDPMFARREAIRPQPATPEITPVKPEPTPASPVKIPVLLPDFNAGQAASIPLPLLALFSQPALSSQVEELALRTNANLIPQPPDPPKPALHTRKRRVTVPDDPPENL
ncbi:MAG: tetratricopeptide repeat protein [Acidobacteria bacterium]|nr:tetratricopeptide repeat protein [Acidobacteriota bacterium]